MKNFIQRLITSCVLISLLIGMYRLPSFLFTFASITILLFILIFEWPTLCKNSFIVKIVTPVYLGIPFISLILLNNSKYKPILILLYLLVATFDIGSYLIGKLFGRHTIIPSISPGKTWEGFFGGLAITLSLTALFLSYHHLKFSFLHLLLVLTTCLLALLGDLFESFLKRRAGIKDSGSILPGHGGLLDRFDSLFFTLPFFYLLRKCLFMLFFS